MQFKKISLQFAQLQCRSCLLPLSPFLLASVCLSYFNFNLSLSPSPILCCWLSCPPPCSGLSQISIILFSQHLHINLKPSLPSRLPSSSPSRGAENGEKVEKAWLRCHFINAAPWETAWMKAPMLLENDPPNRGQVICYTTTNIQDATQSEKGTNRR